LAAGNLLDPRGKKIKRGQKRITVLAKYL
jgi:hypothetical protein